jgi:hypothetical protein
MADYSTGVQPLLVVPVFGSSFVLEVVVEGKEIVNAFLKNGFSQVTLAVTAERNGHLHHRSYRPPRSRETRKFGQVKFLLCFLQRNFVGQRSSCIAAKNTSNGIPPDLSHAILAERGKLDGQSNTRKCGRIKRGHSIAIDEKRACRDSVGKC